MKKSLSNAYNADLILDAIPIDKDDIIINIAGNGNIYIQKI